MGHLLAYSIASGAVLLVLWAVYRRLLAAENQPGFNRAVLLAIYAVALAAPLLAPLMQSPGTSHAGLALPGAARLTGFEAPDTASAHTAVWLTGLYVAGAVCAAAATVATAVRLWAIVHSGRMTRAEGYVDVRIGRSDVAPFSWGRYMVMGAGEDAASAAMIEAHELAHIRARHYIDLVVSQLVCILMWYNPAAWLMQRELKAVHEYQADRDVLGAGCDPRTYQLMLLKKTVGLRFPSLANSLNHSNLKKRITMMYSKKTSVARRCRAAALVPAAAMALALLGAPAVSGAMSRLAASTAIDAKVTAKPAHAQEPRAAAPAAPAEPAAMPAAEVQPQYRGGEAAMFKYMMENMRYPEESEKARQEGRVVVGFTVTADGGVEDIKIKRSVSPSLDAEAMRVVSGMSGSWQPGSVDGKPVRCTMAIPVSFKLQ